MRFTHAFRVLMLKDTLREYLRTMFRESVCQELVRWATQRTIATLAVVGVVALETLIEP